MRELLYDCLYMDNGFFTSSDENLMVNILESLSLIFEPHRFFLQQMYSNLPILQESLDRSLNQETADIVKVLGLSYNRITDTLYASKVSLKENADSKRKVISSIAENFDVLQTCGPILSRARLFAHSLQCTKRLDWDQKLPPEKIKEWKNICAQVERSREVEIARYVGDRNGDYSLICFTDASKLMVGCVLYLKENSSGKVSFLIAKNRIVSHNMDGKTIPKLELHGLCLGVEIAEEIMKELTGENSLVPISISKIYLFSDSMVALSWVDSFVNKLSKMQNCNSFVMNRLERILVACEKFPMHFCFISGHENPADLITRAVSYQQFMKSNYINGPAFLNKQDCDSMNLYSFCVPHR